MSTWTQITSMDAPSSNVFAMTGLTLSSYSAIQIVCAGITVATDATDIALTFYVSSSEVTSGYRWGIQGIGHVSGSASALVDGSTSAAGILLVSDNANWDVGNAATEHFGCLIEVDQPTGSLHKRAKFESILVGPTGGELLEYGVGVMENTGAIDGIKISGTSNLTAGKVRVLGIA